MRHRQTAFGAYSIHLLNNDIVSFGLGGLLGQWLAYKG
jgi:hypothetical protein